MDDPKKRQPKEERETDTVDLAAQVASLQSTVQLLLAQKSSGLDEDKLEAILTRVAQISAEAQERAANPSNKTHPAISVFSRPKGDREDPRDPLKCEMLWGGYPIGPDTTTDEEITLLNLAEPGEFAFSRTDGSRDTLFVRAQRNAAGAVHRLFFEFQTKENRETLPSMASMLRQAYHVKSAEQLELERLRKEVEELRAVHA